MNLAVCLLTSALLFTPAVKQEPNPIVTLVKAKLKHPDQPFVMLITVKVKVGKEKAFEAAMAETVKGTRQEKGNVAYRLHHDTEDANTYVLYEHWKNLDVMIEHMKLEHTEKLLKQLGDLLDGPPQIKVLTVVAE